MYILTHVGERLSNCFVLGWFTKLLFVALWKFHKWEVRQSGQYFLYFFAVK